MKRIIKLSGITLACILVVLILAIWISYARSVPSREDSTIYNEAKYFDLWIADKFFVNDTNQWFNPYTNSRIRLGWIIPVEELENDSITVTFMNNTNEKLYYLGFSHPLVEYDYVADFYGIADTIGRGRNLGEFEGAKYFPMKKNESISIKLKNPLLLYPWFEHYLPTDTEEFPKIMKDVYGDVVQVRFKVFVRGLPWNKHGFSIANSDYIKIPIDTVIKGWKKGNFEKVKYDPESHGEYFVVRKEMFFERKLNN